MAQSKPKRKRSTARHKPAKIHPLNRFYRSRVIKRAVERQKKKRGEKEWKNILFIIFCILLTVVGMVLLNHITKKMHEERELHTKEARSVTKF